MTTYLEQLETPVPIVDMDRLAFNLDRMAAYATLHGLRLRPHVKTHKSPRIAAEQMRLGAVGLTCATLRAARSYHAGLVASGYEVLTEEPF